MVATRPPASITRVGRYEPFELQVARGQISWHESVTVFGYNPDVDTSIETIWPQGGVLTSPGTAVQLSVSSDNTDDTALGTGARTIYLAGLDSNHNPISEIVTLNGQTAVTTVKSYLHINDCRVLTAGSGNSAAGNIYFGTGALTLGVPATVYDIIKYDYNTRVTGSYTIPSGYTGYVVQGKFTAGQSGGGNPITGRLTIRTSNNIRYAIAVTTINNGAADYTFEYPVAIPEKTTVEAEGAGASNNNYCSSMFIILLIKNDAGTA